MTTCTISILFFFYLLVENEKQRCTLQNLRDRKTNERLKADDQIWRSFATSFHYMIYMGFTTINLLLHIRNQKTATSRGEK